MDASVKWIHLYRAGQLAAHSTIQDRRWPSVRIQPDMTDARNSDGAVDLSQPGGGSSSPATVPDKLSRRPRSEPFIPIPYVTSSAAGWNQSASQQTLV